MRKEDPFFYQAHKNGINYKELLEFKRKVTERRKNQTNNYFTNKLDEDIENPIIKHQLKISTARGTLNSKNFERIGSGDKRSSRKIDLRGRVSMNDLHNSEHKIEQARSCKIKIPHNLKTFRGINSIKQSFNSFSKNAVDYRQIEETCHKDSKNQSVSLSDDGEYEYNFRLDKVENF